MPLQIQLTGTGPGQGVIDIAGGDLGGESFELAVQRSSDDKFLGTDLLWQTTPYWHVCYRIEGTPDRLRLAAGAEIVDGVVESSVHALRILVRAGRVQAQAILRTKRLVGSPAGSSRSAPAPVLAPPPAPPSPPAPEIPAPLPPAPEPAPPVESSRRSYRIVLALLMLGILLVATGAGAWYFGLLDPWLAPEEVGTAQTPPPTEPQADPLANQQTQVRVEPGTADAIDSSGQEKSQEIGSSPTPDLVGRPLVQQYLTEQPSAQDLFARARDRDQAGDCEAAILLYERAASADPRVAGEVARLYDPDGFEPSACIESPSEENAIVWYQDAARAGVLSAQGRLGAMLVDRADSGAIHERGVEWLRKAAAAGDADAKRVLGELEQR